MERTHYKERSGAGKCFIKIEKSGKTGRRKRAAEAQTVRIGRAALRLYVRLRYAEETGKEK